MSDEEGLADAMKRGHWLTCVAMTLAAAMPAGARDDFASAGYAQSAAVYLQAPIQPHAAGLGTAVTAWRTGLAGLQYNPAIVDGAEGPQIVGSYSFLTDQRALRGMDLVTPVGDYLVAGISVVNAGVSGIERRDEYGMLDPASPSFDDHELSVAATAGGRVLGTIGLAGRVRYLYQRLDDRRAHGVGIEAGATWTPVPQLCVGLSGLNLYSRLWWSERTDNALPQARLGICAPPVKGLAVEIDGARAQRQPVDGSMAVEYTMLDVLAVRAGAMSSLVVTPFGWRDPTISGGLGVGYSYFGADYAITVPLDDAWGLIAHKVSLVFTFPGIGLFGGSH